MRRSAWGNQRRDDLEDHHSCGNFKSYPCEWSILAISLPERALANALVRQVRRCTHHTTCATVLKLPSTQIDRDSSAIVLSDHNSYLMRTYRRRHFPHFPAGRTSRPPPWCCESSACRLSVCSGRASDAREPRASASASAASEFTREPVGPKPHRDRSEHVKQRAAPPPPRRSPRPSRRWPLRARNCI